MTSEAKIQHAIRLELGQEDDLVLWRNECGVARHSKGGRDWMVTYGLTPGSADLVGIHYVYVGEDSMFSGYVGRFFALEVKSAKGRIDKKQTQFLELVRRMGGFAAVVRSVEEARAALDRARGGESK